MCLCTGCVYVCMYVCMYMFIHMFRVRSIIGLGNVSFNICVLMICVGGMGESVK